MKSINDQLYGFSYELNHTTEEDLTTCFAIDTGTVFVAYGGVWYEQPTRWAEQSGGGGGGGSGVLVVNFVDGDTLDKTWQEIHDAFKTVGAVVSSDENNLQSIDAVEYFSRTGQYGVTVDGMDYVTSSPTGYPKFAIT